MKELPEDKKPFVKLIGGSHNIAGQIGGTMKALERAAYDARERATLAEAEAERALNDAAMYETALEEFKAEYKKAEADDVMGMVLDLVRDRSEREIESVEFEISVPVAVAKAVIERHGLAAYPSYVDDRAVERIFAALKELVEDWETSDQALADLIELGVQQADYTDSLYETCRDCCASEPLCRCDEHDEDYEFEEED